MRKIKSILLALVAMVLAISCEDDGGKSVLTLDEGAAPNFVVLSSSDQFIDLNRVNSGGVVNLNFKAEVAQGKPASTDIVGIYTTITGSVYRGIFIADATLPQDYTLNIDDIVAAFSEINSTADIQVGDLLAISAKFTMPNGTVLEIVSPDGITGGTGTNIATTVLFKTVISFPVSCLSELGGTHTYVSTNLVAANSTTPCPTGEVTGSVTWTDQGGGSYLVSDLGFGQYPSSCWNDGPATSGGAIITEICSELISGGTDQYGLVYTWVITDVSGPELSMTWSNDYGDSGTVVVTREGGNDWPPLFTK